MKTDFKLDKLFVSLMILGCSFGFTACSDDDDNDPTPPITSEIDMEGDYEGIMQVSLLDIEETNINDIEEGEEQEGTKLTASIENDTIYLNDFPIYELVAAIIGSEEQAETIVEAIGQVNYKVAYEGTTNEAKDSVFMTFDPQPLEIIIPAEKEEDNMTITVTISASNKGSYEVETENLKFDFIAEKVTLNNGEFSGFPTSLFDFNMIKK